MKASKRSRPVKRRSSTTRPAAITTAVPERPNQGPIIPVMPSAALALPVEEVNASSGPLDWKALVMAGILALGFSSTFLGPVLHIQTDQRSGGQILGDSDSRPLTIPVTINKPERSITITTKPSSGTITEALARAAAAIGGELLYSSRGASIYVQEYLHSKNSDQGTWEIRVNDVIVSDLSSRPLIQGDTVTATYIPL